MVDARGYACPKPVLMTEAEINKTNADEIIVLENGAVKERGTHAELIGKRGLYYSTYEAQYGDYRNALAVNE